MIRWATHEIRDDYGVLSGYLARAFAELEDGDIAFAEKMFDVREVEQFSFTNGIWLDLISVQQQLQRVVDDQRMKGVSVA